MTRFIVDTFRTNNTRYDTGRVVFRVIDTKRRPCPAVYCFKEDQRGREAIPDALMSGFIEEGVYWVSEIGVSVGEYNRMCKDEDRSRREVERNYL